eukprot:CAMPEP_0176139198 /NCGR_PEP_ID=MMETSP0120_2-20121206/70720_1 /TAXON_ID=160619 /ORGANISM="Kryptoperidinium foliaceum, Strain CCMP 1326" /LENGTH=153 /DNA_ID=CAMNT_0017475173 /DNA_START=72 /DNA_END=530 /DNA_ORIENTATION=+
MSRAMGALHGTKSLHPGTHAMTHSCCGGFRPEARLAEGPLLPEALRSCIVLLSTAPACATCASLPAAGGAMSPLEVDSHTVCHGDDLLQVPAHGVHLREQLRRRGVREKFDDLQQRMLKLPLHHLRSCHLELRVAQHDQVGHQPVRQLPLQLE